MFKFSFLFSVASYFDQSLSDDIIILPFAVTGAAIIYGKADTFVGPLNVGRMDITGIYLGKKKKQNKTKQRKRKEIEKKKDMKKSIIIN